MDKELKAFRKLIVWQRAHALTLMLYKASEKFPKRELSGLTNQVRRSAVSVEANSAEGYALGTSPNFLKFLRISVGSLAETENHVEIAHDLKYLSDTDYERIAEKAREVGYLLSRLKSPIATNQKESSIPHNP